MGSFLKFIMARQNVKTEQRLSVELKIIFPNLNRNKSYHDKSRKFKLFVDEELIVTLNQHSARVYTDKFKLRSLIKVEKIYGVNSKPDSTFEYRIGNNFAILTNQSGFKKRVEVDFSLDNTLKIRDDIDFNQLQAI